MSGKSEKIILVTNDDGYNAWGFKELCQVASEYGKVIAVAPFEGQSGKSHAITVNEPLRLFKMEEKERITTYACTGTPVDCVKLALNQLFPHKPDMLFSGINHGGNASASVIYSGTMAAAREGAINQVPSIGFSYLDYSMTPDYTFVRKVIRKVINLASSQHMPDWFCLNVNIPVITENEMKGIKICRQTKGFWKEEFDKRTDPHGLDYYWLTGKFENLEPDAPDTDEWALKNNYVSIVPIQIDTTSTEAMKILDKWDWT